MRLFGFDEGVGVILEGVGAVFDIWSTNGRRAGLVDTGIFPGRILMLIDGCGCLF